MQKFFFNDELLNLAKQWFLSKGWEPFLFQEESWIAYLQGNSGLVNAPTGSGKTYALALGAFLEFIRSYPIQFSQLENNGLRIVWITPIRALAKEIQQTCRKAADELGLKWQVGLRTGDTPGNERARQWKYPPEFLISTPESLHLMLAGKGYEHFFRHLQAVVVDEWHELIGSKRGVLVELGLSRLRAVRPELKTWGISATIGNMEESLEILMGGPERLQKAKVIKADIEKEIEVLSVIPPAIENLPWAGHLGIRMLEQALPIIHRSSSTLIFTNTRSQCEIWYHRLLEIAPDLAGQIAMHHGSISREIRDWVEEAIQEGKLKAVVCTSSLDLGVDFRPVETVIQVGSPKGVARFMQRAGRSGHQPGAVSKIYFVPTHALELLEGAALRHAIADKQIESRIPYLRSFDVLIQYLMTLAVSDGFKPKEILQEVRQTFSFQSISDKEWSQVLDFITTGGQSLSAYDEFKKVEEENGVWKVNDLRTARRHRLSIGAIVGDTQIKIQFLKGGTVGHVEEGFIAQLKPGDVFWFAGRSLELVRFKEMIALVRLSKEKNGKVPSWMGARMPLSSQLSAYLRLKMDEINKQLTTDPEIEALEPLIALQKSRSQVPAADEFLIEYFQSREGYHLVVFPFEGRFVHEGMASLIAYRLSLKTPITFSIAMNDYGFELLSDTPLPVADFIDHAIFSCRNLQMDIQASLNAVEMARRKFRDIASIAGLVFKGFPGREKKDRHLQASSQLFFDVFYQYEPDNLLLMQSFEESISFQLEEVRLRQALERIQTQKIVLTYPEKPTPFAFPIIADRLNREKLSSEKLEDRIKKLKLED